MTDAAPLVWLDANIYFEIFSLSDILQATTPKERRKRQGWARESLWAAMALCRIGAQTQVYGTELLYQIQKVSPPNSERGGWTAVALYVLVDGGVFDGWTRPPPRYGDRHLKSEGVDRLMVRICRRLRVPLITRDTDTREKKAKKVGALALLPDAFARPFISLDDARREFIRRLDVALDAFVSSYPKWTHGQRVKFADQIHRVYRHIWLPHW